MDPRAFIMDWLDPISVVVGLAIAVPVVWTWIDVVWGRRRRQRQWFRKARADAGPRPAVLVVDLLPGKDVRAQVAHCLAGMPELAAIPDERRFHLARHHPLKPDDLPDLARDIRARAADIARAGCDTVHCFYAGPTAAAALVGAEFANAARCLLYQYQNGRYENWGPIRHGLD